MPLAAGEPPVSFSASSAVGASLRAALSGTSFWMARTFGTVRPEVRKGRATTYYIDCWVYGKRYKLRSVHLAGGRPFRFGASKQVAEEMLEAIRSDIRHGVGPRQAIAPYLSRGSLEIAFRTHWGRFVESKRRQAARGQLSSERLGELEGHERRGQLAPLLDLPLQDVGYAVLEDWRDWLFDTTVLKPKTIQHLIKDVGTCLRWLAKRKEIESPPELPPVHVPTYQARIPNGHTRDLILAAIPWEKRGLFLARGYNGLRDKEARRANVQDYDFRSHSKTGKPLDQLAVQEKGGGVRYLPVDPELSRWVREHHEPTDRLRDAEEEPQPLFPNPRGLTPDKRWSKASARRVMLAAMGAAKTGHFRPNEVLRHGFGTEAAERLLGFGHSEGDAVRMIMTMMGHTEAKTSARYVQIAAETLRGVLRKEGE